MCDMSRACSACRSRHYPSFIHSSIHSSVRLPVHPSVDLFVCLFARLFSTGVSSRRHHYPSARPSICSFPSVCSPPAPSFVVADVLVMRFGKPLPAGKDVNIGGVVAVGSRGLCSCISFVSVGSRMSTESSGSAEGYWRVFGEPVVCSFAMGWKGKEGEEG